MQLVINRPKNWPILQKGDSIYLVSPASGSTEEEISNIERFIKNWGFNPILYHHNSKNTHPFLSHNDNDRFLELKDAIYGEKSAIIASIRGGYGSARLLSKLLKLPKPKNKILLGFSDITSLHLAFNNHWNISSLHAPTIKQCAFEEVDQYSINLLKNILTNKQKTLSYCINPINNFAKSIKSSTKFPRLLGGNISLLQTSIATDWKINNNEPFCLLIEEIDEKPYSIDRMLHHLLHSGIFNNCKALFIGDINKESDENKDIIDKILDNFINKPIFDEISVFSIDNIGHGRKNLPIILNEEFYVIPKIF